MNEVLPASQSQRLQDSKRDRYRGIEFYSQEIFLGQSSLSHRTINVHHSIASLNELPALRADRDERCHRCSSVAKHETEAGCGAHSRGVDHSELLSLFVEHSSHSRIDGKLQFEMMNHPDSVLSNLLCG